LLLRAGGHLGADQGRREPYRNGDEALIPRCSTKGPDQTADHATVMASVSQLEIFGRHGIAARDTVFDRLQIRERSVFLAGRSTAPSVADAGRPYRLG
jgi:hypothetical protein